MELHIGVPFEPAIILGFMRVQVVQNHMNLPVRIGRHNLVHEFQKFPTAAPIVMARLDLPSGDVESRKQRRRAVSLIAMTESIDRACPLGRRR